MRTHTDAAGSTNEGYETEETEDQFYDEEEEEQEDFGRRSSSSSSRHSMAITPALPRNHNHPASPTPRGSRRNRTARTTQQQHRHTSRGLPRDPTFTSSHYPRSLSASQIFTQPPHLAPSRRLSHRLSTWRAPSFDEALNTLLVTRCNRQILFFCLGFVCPLLWMVAAFLPIPPRPADAQVNANVNDLEDLNGKEGRYALGVQMEMMDWEHEKRFLKARWWRTLNRIMSVVGVAVIAAIVSNPFFTTAESVETPRADLISVDCACGNCFPVRSEAKFLHTSLWKICSTVLLVSFVALYPVLPSLLLSRLVLSLLSTTFSVVLTRRHLLQSLHLVYTTYLLCTHDGQTNASSTRSSETYTSKLPPVSR